VTGQSAEQHLPGKKASWIELYFDLIFVFAVGQVTHLVVERHTVAGVAVALGLFMTLWWTWIGFALLYNRHGEDRAAHRLIILAGTIPCAIAAVQLHGVLEGHVGGFALALAGARVVLAVAYLLAVREGQPSRRAGAGYTLSAAAFAASAAVPGAWRYVIWGIALVQEAGFLLLDANRRGARPGADGNRRGSDGGSRDRARRDRRDAVRAALSAPVSPGLAIDASHLSERFGLLMILLLGEVVITVCAAAADIADHGGGYWLGLFAGLILAGALWWIYFDSASRVSEYVLRASGGNPTMAYTIYAGGHVLPAFSLLIIAAGVNLSMHENPPDAAAWLVSCGLAAYLFGTRAFTTGTVSGVRVRALRALVIVLTVSLALLYRVMPTVGVVAITAGWAVLAAVVASARSAAVLRQLRDNPLHVFGDR
jgi:low temperature requirement protein LtrA